MFCEIPLFFFQTINFSVYIHVKLPGYNHFDQSSQTRPQSHKFQARGLKKQPLHKEPVEAAISDNSEREPWEDADSWSFGCFLGPPMWTTSDQGQGSGCGLISETSRQKRRLATVLLNKYGIFRGRCKVATVSALTWSLSLQLSATAGLRWC